jgi:argininosuccinate synthase
MLKKTQLEHTENLGAIAQKGKKLETKQISEKYHVFQLVNNTSSNMAQRNTVKLPVKTGLSSKVKLNIDFSYRN